MQNLKKDETVELFVAFRRKCKNELKGFVSDGTLILTDNPNLYDTLIGLKEHENNSEILNASSFNKETFLELCSSKKLSTAILFNSPRKNPKLPSKSRDLNSFISTDEPKKLSKLIKYVIDEHCRVYDIDPNTESETLTDKLVPFLIAKLVVNNKNVELPDYGLYSYRKQFSNLADKITYVIDQKNEDDKSKSVIKNKYTVNQEDKSNI